MKHLFHPSPGDGEKMSVLNSFASSLRLLALLAMAVPVMIFSSCTADPFETEPGGFDTRAGNYQLLDLISSSAYDMTVATTGTREYRLTTTGTDPYISTTVLTSANPPSNVVLTFTHKGDAIDDFQIYFSNPLSETRSISGLSIPASDNWTEWSVVLGAQISQFNWGAAGHYVRLDFGRAVNKTISVKDIYFREVSAGDKEVMNLVVSSAHNMTASEPLPSSYRMVTNGVDPYIFTSQLTRANPANAVNLSFQYKSSHTIGDVQIFFGDPITQDRSVYWLNLPEASEWTDWTMDMSAAIYDFNWGAVGSRLRFDFGGVSGRTIEMRNIRFEEPDYELLGFVTSNKNQLTVDQTGSYEYELTTTGVDPYIQTTPLQKNNPTDSYVLTFEYKAPQTIDDVQIFLGPPVAENRSVRGLSITPSSEWKEWSVQLTEPIIDFNWGAAGNYLRLDLGNFSGKSLTVRNLHFRPLNHQEQEELSGDASMVVNLKKYFKTAYSSQVSQVNVSTSTVSVSGFYSGADSYSLCEVPPYLNVTEIKNFEYKTQLSSPSFNIQFDRYVVRNGINYDRVLSKWVVVKNGVPDEIVSHARHADAIQASRNLSEVPLTGKKGLSDYSLNNPLQTQDLDDLGIRSMTVNIPISDHMYSSGGGGRIAHSYGGQTFYFDAVSMNRFDAIMLNAHTRSIPVAAVILIRPAASCPDPVIGNALQHPNYDPSIGIFTMPDMTTAEGTNTYAAALDFLAARYCRSDNLYGRISKWIMHNEVDMGIHWNNMGDKHIMLYTEAYTKSLRMCHNIAKSYDPHAEVLASFSHSWAISADPMYYPVLDMINLMKSFSDTEGDFRWGLAYHSYPLDLTEPKTWNDEVAFSANTPYLTFNNLEVLSAWANHTSNKYQGTVKRSVWLSENGTNSRSYSAAHLKEQAAGMAYAWKKINALSGIDAIQWHNWFDNPAEGLNLGLRKSPSDNYDPKPVWYSYKAAGTALEDSEFEQYKSVIGITDWGQIMHTVSGF